MSGLVTSQLVAISVPFFGIIILGVFFGREHKFGLIISFLWAIFCSGIVYFLIK